MTDIPDTRQDEGITHVRMQRVKQFSSSDGWASICQESESGAEMGISEN